MKLNTADKVLGRLNLSGTIGSSDPVAINSALDSATEILSSILRTPLKATTRKDYFDYSLGRYSTFKPFTLWLSQAFLSSTPKIYISNDGTPVSNLADTTLLTTSEYLIDKDKGKLTVLKEVTQGNSTILVKYTAGFKEGARNIPDWLAEAAISAAIFANHTQGVVHGKKDVQAMVKPLAGLLYSTVNEYIITQYSGLYPVNTVQG